MIRAREAQAFNNRVHTISFLLPDATDMYDLHLFAMVPPQIRPDTERRPVHTDSFLCQTCRSALEYFVYFVEESKFNRPRVDDGEFPCVVARHRDLYSLRNSVRLDCYLCVFLARPLHGIEVPDELIETLYSILQIELCWLSDIDMLEVKVSGPSRINFAPTDPSEERTSQYYFNFIRLQLWPANDFACLFAIPPEIGSYSPKSSAAEDRGQDRLSSFSRTGHSVAVSLPGE